MNPTAEAGKEKGAALRAALTAGPGVAWLAMFLLAPTLLLVVYAFLSRNALGQVTLPLTLANVVRFAGWDALGYDPAIAIITLRSIEVAFVTTAICVVLAYPIAFFIAAHGPRTRNLLLTLVVLPSWTNLVIRTYAWLIVFGPGSPLSDLAARLGLIARGSALEPSPFAVYVGMVNAFLPFVVLPIYSAVERLDWNLVEAARDLYAPGWRIFADVILPQTLAGLSAGVILTAIPAFGMFVVPDLLGGARTDLIGNVIAQQFGSSRDWPFGAAISLAVMILTLLALALYIRRYGEQGMRDIV